MNHFEESYLRHKLLEPPSWKYASSNRAPPAYEEFNIHPTMEESYLRHKLPEPPTWKYASNVSDQPAYNGHGTGVSTEDIAAAHTTTAEENMTDAKFLAARGVPPSAADWALQPPEGTSAYDSQRSSNDYGTGLTHKDWDAACALVAIRHESQDIFRGYIQRHNGDMKEANKALVRDMRIMKPHKAFKARKDSGVPKEVQEGRDRIDAALMLIKLSGQSPNESKAALVLMRLKAAGAKVLRDELLKKQNEQRQKEVVVPLAQTAMKKKSAVDRFLARNNIRTKTPYDLRGSKGAGGGNVRKAVDSVEEEEV